MRCRRLQPYLLALLEGELPPKQRQQVEAHVAECPACAVVLRGMQQTLHMVRALDGPAPDETSWETFLPALRQRLRQEEELCKRRPTRPWIWQVGHRPALVALAASLLLVSAMPLLRGVWKQHAPPGLGLSGSEDASLAAELDFLNHLDLLEEEDVVEDADASP